MARGHHGKQNASYFFLAKGTVLTPRLVPKELPCERGRQRGAAKENQELGDLCAHFSQKKSEGDLCGKTTHDEPASVTYMRT